jgi:hypothetical protein
MKAKGKTCCNCNEEIVRGMAFPIMEKSICMSCFVHFGLAQKTGHKYASLPKLFG